MFKHFCTTVVLGGAALLLASAGIASAVDPDRQLQRWERPRMDAN